MLGACVLVCNMGIKAVVTSRHEWQDQIRHFLGNTPPLDSPAAVGHHQNRSLGIRSELCVQIPDRLLSSCETRGQAPRLSSGNNTLRLSASVKGQCGVSRAAEWTPSECLFQRFARVTAMIWPEGPRVSQVDVHLLFHGL